MDGHKKDKPSKRKSEIQVYQLQVIKRESVNQASNIKVIIIRKYAGIIQ